MQVATTAPQTSNGLLAVCPNMAKFLSVVFLTLQLAVSRQSVRLSAKLLESHDQSSFFN
jgi:uncharacterized phage infection (PIP) family protein YhgE